MVAQPFLAVHAAPFTRIGDHARVNRSPPGNAILPIGDKPWPALFAARAIKLTPNAARPIITLPVDDWRVDVRRDS